MGAGGPSRPATPHLPPPASPVLVTGGTGFIGRRVVQRCLALAPEVRSFSLPGETAPPEWGGRTRLFHGDIADPHAVGEATDGVQTIIHLAAVVGRAGDYDLQWRIIADGTRVVCEAAYRNGARLVVVSSIAVYGDYIQTQVCNEDTGFGAWQGAYGRAKQAQETVAREFAALHGIPLTIVRPANVYGLGGSSAWGDRFIAMLRATGGAVVGDGEHNNAGLVYVDNLADALVLAAAHARAMGRTYNVCDGLDVTWRQYTNDMARLAGVPAPPSVPLGPLLAAARANEDPVRLVGPRDAAVPSLEGLNLVGFDNRIDTTRIRRELGWMPQTGYEDAMADMAAHVAAERGP